MKILLLGLAFASLLFSQQLTKLKVESKGDALEALLIFEQNLPLDSIIKGKQSLEIRGISPIKPITKTQNLKTLKQLSITSKDGSIFVHFTEQSPTNLDFKIHQNTLLLRFTPLLKTDNLSYQYTLMLLILSLLILALWLLKRYLPKGTKHTPSMQKYPIDSKTSILSITLEGTRYLILISPRGNLLLDKTTPHHES